MGNVIRTIGVRKWLDRILGNLRDHAEHPEKYVGMTEQDVADARHDAEILADILDAERNRNEK